MVISYKKKWKKQKEILNSTFVIMNNGQAIAGPLSLEDFYYILKYGGKKWHGSFRIDLEVLS